MFKKFGAALIAALFFASPAAAISQLTDASAIVRVNAGPVVVAQAAPIAAPTPTVIVPPTNDSVVTPDGKGGVTISVGSALGSVWVWAITAFSGILVAIVITWVRKLMAKMGVQMTADQEAELARALQDGFNHAATGGEQLVTGKLPIEVKDPNAAAAILFAISQKSALIKSMGLDPNSGDVVKMLQAKLATLKVDPNTPTVVETQSVSVKPDGLTAQDKSKIV